MKKPQYNKKTNKWEIWIFEYVKNNEKYYEHHEWWDKKDAWDFWKMHNPKIKNTIK